MTEYLQRWLKQSFTRTWNWGDSISGIAASTIAIAAHFFPAWGRQVNDDLWTVPIWGLAGAILFRLIYSAPYELWKREKERADVAAFALEAIGSERQLRFLWAEFRFDYSGGASGPLVELRLIHENLSSHLISYRLADVWLELDDEKVLASTPTRTTYQQPRTQGHYDCKFQVPIDIASYPAPVRVNFDYFYDTVPGSRERRSGSTLRYVITGAELGAPVEGYWFDDQREA